MRTSDPKRKKKILFIIFGGFVAITSWQAIFYKFFPVMVTPVMVINQIEHPTELTFKRWVPLSKISSNMVLAVISSEDNRFFEHCGFDFKAIQLAASFNDRKNGRKVRGGSTISQQTAKNVFLVHNRSYLRKAIEVYYTLMIERIWGKERIMEVYLNVVEVGKSVYGVEAGARRHFRTTAAKLSRGQAARIAAVLPAPRRFDASHPSSYVRRRQYTIQSLMYKMPTPPMYVHKRSAKRK